MISLRCTVVRADRPQGRSDLEVVAPVGSTAADLVDALVEAGVLDAPAPLSAGGVIVPGATELGRRPLLNGALLVAGGAWRDGGHPPRSLLELHVASGPDAGSVLPLSAGTVSVGRDPSAALCVADLRLSRKHFALTLDSKGLRLHDLGSSNGTEVDGASVAPDGTACAPGSRIRAGATTFVVRSPGHRTVAHRATGEGVLAVTRGPRSDGSPVTASFRRRPPPEPTERAPLPWIAMLAPLVLCAPLAWLMRQPTYLLLGLTSPLAVGVGHVVERRGRRRRDREQRAAWQSADQRTSALVDQAVAADLARRRTATLDAALLLQTARLPGHRLWECGPGDDDLLHLALGSGEVPSEVVVLTDDGETRPPLPDAPVVLDLAEVGHLGVSGAAEDVSGVLRLLLGRLAVQCSPDVLRLVTLGAGDRWARWLPHHGVSSPGALAQEVRRRLELADPSWGPPTTPRVVVLLDDVTCWSADPAVGVVLDDGPRAGVHVIAGAHRPEQLPSRCGAVLDLSDLDRAVLTSRDGRRTDLAVDASSATWAEEVARALASLEDASPKPGALPARVRLSDVCGLDPSSADEVAAAWRRSGRATRVAIGAGADGPLHVDLVRDGPHALVAGTTGAGKSELLQTLVCSLALGNRPDELAFVLVDYKGGAAFRDLADLPHVVGLVTDLDAHLAARALASLQAELTRRERLLAEVGAGDFAAYLAARDPGAAPEPLARLVLVVDEFRLLADELPTFLDGLVRLASIGRSLGVHLVLATQRPAGVVSADIKANVNLRICLRVRDRAESDDVVDAPDAAALPVDVPGRAVLRTASDALVPFQVALASGPARAAPPGRVRVRRLTSSDPTTVAQASDGDDGPLALVRAIGEAARACAAVPPPSPWLPPLPDLVRLAQGPTAAHGDVAVSYGVVDRPDAGTQQPLTWDASASSHLAVSGMARTGRSTACLALVLAAAERHGPVDLHVHVIEASPRLGPALAGLPHLGTVAEGGHPRVIARLVRRLGREPARSRHTLLVVDGWDAVTESLDALDHGRTTDELLALLRDGERWGLRAVVAGGRGVLSPRVSSVLSERLLLRTADPTDLLLAGAPSSTPLAHQPPGRAVHLPSGLEVQIAWPGDEPEVRGRVEALRARHPGRPAAPPLQLRPLPARVEVAGERQHLAGLTVQVGVGGDDGEPVALDLSSVPVVAVVGPPGSGRSSTLASWAAQLHDRGVGVLALADPASPLSHGTWPVRDPLSATDDDWPAEVGCLLVDEADRLPDSMTRRYATWASAAPADRALVVATTTDALSASFTGLAAAVRRHRTGVLLQPERPLDGDAFGVVAERPDVRTPGRGLLVARGQSTPVQVALPAGHASRTAKWGTPSCGGGPHQGGG
ncbi:MAG: FtsK/SpoIIIE domain-containing protein [Angustibacter sp.]